MTDDDDATSDRPSTTGPHDALLVGGNMNVVRREGDTVTRTAGPWTPTIHRYLDHLRLAGVDWAPRPLGVEGDRERLTFLDGDVPVYPLPAWIWSDEILVEGARRLRQLHDASIGFALDGAVWQSPAKVPSEVVCHNDFSPHNLAFVDGQFLGAIDFDMASPGPRLWDLAYYATRIVPLTDDTPDEAPGMDDARRRVGLLLDAYGSDETFEAVLRVAIIRLHDLAVLSDDKADELGKPELHDHASMYRREAAYLAGLAV